MQLSTNVQCFLNEARGRERFEQRTAARWQYYIEHHLREVRLLGPAEMGSLFPGSKILKERFLGLTKSLIAAKQ